MKDDCCPPRKVGDLRIQMPLEPNAAIENALALEELRLSKFLTEASEIGKATENNIRADAVINGAYGGSRLELLIEEHRLQFLKDYFDEAVRLREESAKAIPAIDADEYYELLAQKLERSAENYYEARLDNLRRAKASSGQSGPIPGTFDAEKKALVSDARRRVELLRRTRKLEASLNSHPIQAARAKDTRKVFVVHGRNMKARDAMFDFLRAIDLAPIEWIQAVQMTGKASPYMGEILETAFREAQAVVVLLTGDDMARLGTRYIEGHDPSEETELTPQARPNVLFEAGLAFGTHPERTLLVALGRIRSFSDTVGRHVLYMNDTVAKRQEVAQRLKSAGCTVNIETRMDWHTSGKFEQATLAPDEPAK